MRCLVEDQGTRLFLDLAQTRPAPNRLGGQKTLEDETVRRQTCGRQRRNQGAGPGHRNHGDAGGTRLTHQVVARVRNQRRAGIGNQRHIIASQ